MLVSYICLIFKSTNWLEFVHKQLLKYTDLTDSEYFFIANDATPEVLSYLKDHNIPHYDHRNTPVQQKEWFINNVYRAWNKGIQMAKGKYVMLFNSDMAFTPQWADKLIKSITDDTCVTSRLVERGFMKSGKYGVEKDFGNYYKTYQEENFLKFAKELEKDEINEGGLFMPLLIKKEHMEKVNYYPEGNISLARGTDIFNPVYAVQGEKCMPGDVLFMKKLNTIGVRHVTNFSSIVYHFQMGESRFD